jgi:hypothetical protein
MIDKLKWILAALGAFVLGMLALIYGKETPAVLRSKVRAHNARGRVLNEAIKVAEQKASVEKDEHAKQLHLERANTLKIDRETIEKARLELIARTTGDLPKVESDADLALAHNRDRAKSAAG